ncbi:MAG: septal ring lytic transglycosylase RlpA family protein [Steroidobacteraceae bacterium]
MQQLQYVTPAARFAATAPAAGTRRGLAVLALAAALAIASPNGARRVAVDAAPPAQAPEWVQSGRASWYGPGFHGRRTANGEVFDTNSLTMAHRTLPFGTEVRVTNLVNGRSVVLRVNDRGPYVRGRIADLSHAAAQRLGFADEGVTRVRIDVI